ncbi:MBL fold metallo-hydrolase [Rheinheimera sp. D18]|uniref:MBL fold metallo-hydrolase RNA specificity domain-containing protein n=1 Tax=Rheinheimera sp. D18 TaxID=2545632 RepID=UPI00104938B9|nr:MBL fold metallo-hydrolase [Rheinheimera sp. D18]QBL09799.1 MBL fold metallo-hydrolase [Rheinheimera sp. D18]
MSSIYSSPRFIHHGAVDGVTGSCHEYRISDDYGLLIDCGLFQGAEVSGSGSSSSPQINFPVTHIKALIVTHVHIDHVGRIPYLLAAGFTGPIYCTVASATLLPLVLEDALKVGVTRDTKLIAAFLAKINRQLVACEFKQWVNLPVLADANLQLRLQPAGHILGSAYVELRHNVPTNSSASKPTSKPYKTVFSGDLGAPYAPLLPAPKPPYAADTVVIESTYGDRLHPNRRERVKQLEQVLLHALQDNGTVLFPAFSIGRTQELLYELEAIMHRLRGQKIHQALSWDELQIIVDSPLAARFTDAYNSLKSRWDKEAKHRLKVGRHPLSFEQLHTVDSHEQHLALVQYLASTRQPAIVIAASGMCEGGRVVNYLKALLPDPVHQVVFVGYQARGTLGAAITQYGPKGGYVDIDGERITIGAEIISLSGYSAHADQQGLLRFVLGMKKPPQQVRIVHGDDSAKATLQKLLQEKGVNANLPLPPLYERGG